MKLGELYREQTKHHSLTFLQTLPWSAYEKIIVAWSEIIGMVKKDHEELHGEVVLTNMDLEVSPRIEKRYRELKAWMRLEHKRAIDNPRIILAPVEFTITQDSCSMV